VFQCSKLCDGGDMTRKVICMKDNKTVPVSQCNADNIMFSTEKCNNQLCEEGKNLTRFSSLVFIFLNK